MKSQLICYMRNMRPQIRKQNPPNYSSQKHTLLQYAPLARSTKMQHCDAPGCDGEFHKAHDIVKHKHSASGPAGTLTIANRNNGACAKEHMGARGRQKWANIFTQIRLNMGVKPKRGTGTIAHIEHMNTKRKTNWTPRRN